jgi:quinol monooxygenase YgiN
MTSVSPWRVLPGRGYSHPMPPPHEPIELHLRIRVKRGMRSTFFTFLREAIPFYESPGQIQVRLLQDLANDHRFIELVLYGDRAAYERDQHRVENDPEMRRYLERWRALLDGPPVVEVYGTINPREPSDA